jgi:hypothetical protein
MKMIDRTCRARVKGMTMLEALIVMAALFVMTIFVILPHFARARVCNCRATCINNCKQIGTAYRIWENDNGDKYPAQQTEALGGVQGLATNSVNAGQYIYMVYSIMQNEMGQSPKVVLCPQDDRPPNTNFYYGLANAPKEPGYTWPAPTSYGTFDNSNVSYFCGVGAADTVPQSILGGDRNLGYGGLISSNGAVRYPLTDPNYGISSAAANRGGPCGADAIVNTNGEWVYATASSGNSIIYRGQAVAWSARMHSAANPAGAGNIMLGDGSAQMCTSARLRQYCLSHAVDFGNFASSDKIHSSAAGDIRWIFP